MKSNNKFVKFFCTAAISLALMLGMMVFTNSCADDEEDCPNVAHNLGKIASSQCEKACEDAGYQEHFMDSGNCCCFN